MKSTALKALLELKAQGPHLVGPIASSFEYPAQFFQPYVCGDIFGNLSVIKRAGKNTYVMQDT